MKKALIIIDVQNDYFPSGRMELYGSVEVASKIKSVIEKSRLENTPIIYVKHIAIKKEATFFINGTDGIEIYDGIRPSNEDKILIKNYPNSFRETKLHEICQSMKIDTLVIVGMMTHMCVDTTTRAAFDLGYKSIVIGDCCATKDLQYDGNLVKAKDVQIAYLSALNGTFAKVISEHQYLNENVG